MIKPGTLKTLSTNKVNNLIKFREDVKPFTGKLRALNGTNRNRSDIGKKASADIKSGKTTDFEKSLPYRIFKGGIQIADPTGVTSYQDVEDTWNDGKFDSNDIIEPLGALPVVGKFGKSFKYAKTIADSFKEFKLSRALRTVDAISDAKTAVEATTGKDVKMKYGGNINMKKTPRVLKKMEGGGFSWGKDGQDGDNVAGKIQAGAGLATGLIDAIDTKDKYGVRTTGGAIASGAISGAAAGAAAGPIGMAAGALIGGATSWIGNAKAKREKQNILTETSADDQTELDRKVDARLAANPELKYGSSNAQMYKYGGTIKGVPSHSVKFPSTMVKAPRVDLLPDVAINPRKMLRDGGPLVDGKDPLPKTRVSRLSTQNDLLAYKKTGLNFTSTQDMDSWYKSWAKEPQVLMGTTNVSYGANAAPTAPRKQMSPEEWNYVQRSTGMKEAQIQDNIPLVDRYLGDYRKGMSKMAMGGKLKALSSGAVEVQGPSHDKGGVKVPELGVELEGKETMTDDGFVFSKKLGFAQKHKTIAKAIGREENKPVTPATLRNIKELEAREHALAIQQEELKAKKGIVNGKYKMEDGGPTGKKKLTRQPVVKITNYKTFFRNKQARMNNNKVDLQEGKITADAFDVRDQALKKEWQNVVLRYNNNDELYEDSPLVVKKNTKNKVDKVDNLASQYLTKMKETLFPSKDQFIKDINASMLGSAIPVFNPIAIASGRIAGENAKARYEKDKPFREIVDKATYDSIINDPEYLEQVVSGKASATPKQIGTSTPAPVVPATLKPATAQTASTSKGRTSPSVTQRAAASGTGSSRPKRIPMAQQYIDSRGKYYTASQKKEVMDKEYNEAVKAGKPVYKSSVTGLSYKTYEGKAGASKKEDVMTPGVLGSVSDKTPKIGTLTSNLPSTLQGIPKTAPEISGSKTSLDEKGNTKGDGKTKTDVLGNLAPFASNIANAFRTLPMPPKPTMDSEISPSLINLDASRAEAVRLRRGADKMAAASLNGNNQVAAVKAANLTGQIREINNVNQEENNTNVNIKNQFQQINSNILRGNNLKRDGYNSAIVERRLKQQELNSENMADVSNKYQAIQRDNKLKDLESSKLLTTLMSADKNGIITKHIPGTLTKHLSTEDKERLDAYSAAMQKDNDEDRELQRESIKASMAATEAKKEEAKKVPVLPSSGANTVADAQVEEVTAKAKTIGTVPSTLLKTKAAATKAAKTTTSSKTPRTKR